MDLATTLREIPIFVWLIWLPLLWSPVVYLAGRVARLRFSPHSAVSRWVALLAILSVWLPFTLTWQAFNASGTLSYTVGTITLRLDGLSLLLITAVLALATLVILYSNRYMAGELGEAKYYAMLVAMSGVMIGLACAGDLFNLWLWFEAMAITSYLLVAFYRDQVASLEAGVKYLVQSSVGSVFVLLGIALVLAQTGTLDLLEIQAHAANGVGAGLLAAGALFIIGFGVKVAIVPLHTWLPDAHSQAPSGISAMLSAVVIEAGLIALLRALAPLSGPESAPTWGILLISFGLLNMFLGNLLAMRQQQVKRLLAFSSIAHVGYMLIGLGIAVYFRQVAGAEGSFFHLLSHALMKGLAFLSAGALLYVLHTARGDHDPLVVGDLAGAAQRYPLVALTFSLALLGLGGLPPLVGFVSKWQILLAGFTTQNVWIYVVIGLVAFNSVLSLAYYAPMVNAVYRKRPSPIVQSGERVPALMMAPLLVLGTAVVVIGIWPRLVSGLVAPAGAALMAAFGG
jgi:proton-translocating NADH-quinone oxidoreductase chain N